MTWSGMRSNAIQDTWCEYLSTTLYTALDEQVQSVSGEFAGAATPRDAVEDVCRAGSTTAWSTRRARPPSRRPRPRRSRARRGVCQDFAHLGLAMVRSLGIPARYTSGYLHPSDEDAPIGEVTAGESHAWIEAWVGEWIPLDPTSGDDVGSRHVVVAHGRDYGDVPPLKGVYHGGNAEALDVSVELTRLA